MFCYLSKPCCAAYRDRCWAWTRACASSRLIHGQGWAASGRPIGAVAWRMGVNLDKKVLCILDEHRSVGAGEFSRGAVLVLAHDAGQDRTFDRGFRLPARRLRS